MLKEEKAKINNRLVQLYNAESIAHHVGSYQINKIQFNLFKPHGKWYCDINLDLPEFLEGNGIEELEHLFFEAIGDKFQGMSAVSLANPVGVPVMFHIPSKQ